MESEIRTALEYFLTQFAITTTTELLETLNEKNVSAHILEDTVMRMAKVNSKPTYVAFDDSVDGEVTLFLLGLAEEDEVLVNQLLNIQRKTEKGKFTVTESYMLDVFLPKFKNEIISTFKEHPLDLLPYMMTTMSFAYYTISLLSIVDTIPWQAEADPVLQALVEKYHEIVMPLMDNEDCRITDYHLFFRVIADIFDAADPIVTFCKDLPSRSEEDYSSLNERQELIEYLKSFEEVLVSKALLYVKNATLQKENEKLFDKSINFFNACLSDNDLRPSNLCEPTSPQMSS